MDYLLPSEYVKAFKVLHSTAPEMPFSQLARVVEEDLGRSVEELFDSVEERPLGAASLAQCHRARLRDGREVAVKVQFPDVRRNAETDLKTMEVRALHCVLQQDICTCSPFASAAHTIHHSRPISFHTICTLYVHGFSIFTDFAFLNHGQRSLYRMHPPMSKFSQVKCLGWLLIHETCTH